VGSSPFAHFFALRQASRALQRARSPDGKPSHPNFVGSFVPRFAVGDVLGQPVGLCEAFISHSRHEVALSAAAGAATTAPAAGALGVPARDFLEHDAHSVAARTTARAAAANWRLR
jgi:hypothetical protein